MKNFKKNIISEISTVKSAMQILNSLDSRDSLTLFVVNEAEQLVGTLTDGDVRRGLIAGKNIEDCVTNFMFTKFRFLKKNQFDVSEIQRLKEKEIELIPLINESNNIVRIIDLTKKKSLLPLDAVVMAGGEGMRLRPLTTDLPKPMLLVGDKPIIEHNIDRLNSFGIDNVNITLKYLGGKISDYLGNGSSRGIKIAYVNEAEPLGTIGSLRLIPSFDNEIILVMNSDLLTNIDFEDFYKTFLQKGADMAVASVPYHMNVPYGIFEVDADNVIALKEKPTYTYYSNAGIYLIKKELIDLIPGGQSYNATDLMEKVIAIGLKLIYYPILGYWLDIGKHEDYIKAQEDIKHIKL